MSVVFLEKFTNTSGIPADLLHWHCEKYAQSLGAVLGSATTIDCMAAGHSLIRRLKIANTPKIRSATVAALALLHDYHRCLHLYGLGFAADASSTTS